MADAHLRAIISAVDRLSPVLARQSRMIRGWSKQFERAGKGAIPTAAGLGVALGVPARAFMQAEDAATQLKNTLMTSDGLTTGFEQLGKIATDLGNQLPGTTADFMSMASQLKALGTDTDTLIGGALKASAYLAVVGKPLGVTYDSAAEAVGKLSNAFGIAANDLVPFTDTVQRALHMGIELEQFQYAMARISGPLKAAGIQGLQVANDMTPLVGMLIKAGISGEEAGTGIKKMIEASIQANQFTGVTGLVKDLEKLNKLPLAEKMEKFSDLFGDQHAGKAAIVAAGGYGKMVQDMAKQASLQQRINNSLGTLTNLWDAATGTFTNAMVAFADSYAPELKSLAQSFNDISSKLIDWINANKPLINTAVKVAVGFAAFKLALYGIGWILGSVTNLLFIFRNAILVVSAATKLLSMLFMANPLGIFLTVLAFAVPQIIANWDTITAYLKGAWDKTVDWLATQWGRVVATYANFKDYISGATQQVADYFKGLWQGAIDWVTGKWQGFAEMFPTTAGVISGVVGSIGQAIQATIGGAIDWVISKWQGFVATLSSIGSYIANLGAPNVGSMSLPGQAIQRPPINTSHSFKGSLDINHVNAAPGFRAAPVKSRGAPFKVQQNVGYGYSATGVY